MVLSQLGSCDRETYITEFTPELLKTGNFAEYRNAPVQIANVEAHPSLLDDSFELVNNIHTANPEGNNAIFGLALYKNFYKGFKRIVGSLRYYGYNGHIILGVHPRIGQMETDYLKRMNVSFYAVEMSMCNEDASNNDVKGIIRGKCSKDLVDLKLEWGRFEMARRWLLRCSRCTGWSLIMDTRDIFFQDNPVRNIFNAQSYFCMLVLLLYHDAVLPCAVVLHPRSCSRRCTR